MFSPSRPAKPAASGTLARLTTAGTSVTEPGGRRALRRWGIRLAALVGTLVVLYLLLGVAVRVATTDMWFDSVQHGSVYHRVLGAQVLLFCVFAVVAGLISGATIIALRRLRLPLDVSADNDTFRWIFRKYEPRVGRLLVVLVVAVPAVLVGKQAAASWQTYLLWRKAPHFGTTDPTFHKDAGFFVAVFPFHQLVVTLLAQAVTYALWVAVVGGYWYGGWRIRGGRRKITRGYTSLLSLLAAGYLVVKAANVWLSRYALTTSTRGPVTGVGYTDRTTTLPAKYVLVVVTLLAAVALVANGVLGDRLRGSQRVFGRVRTLTGVLVLTVIASTVIGSTVPSLVYRFREAPSASKLDLGEIANNQKATRAAFGLDGDITTVPYSSSSDSLSSSELVTLAGKTAQTSVIDQNQLSPTFTNQQQLQAYYGFKSTLDIDHYPIDGKSQDVAIAARELKPGAIPKPTWVNTHLVYTHGYGVVAAPTTQVDSKTQGPIYLNGGMPPAQQIPVSRPQVYFSPSLSSSYAIVGQPKSSTRNLEFDHPAGSGTTTTAYSTHQGGGGVPIGSTLRRFAFAYQLSDPNIFFSSELNSASQLLEVRDPRARVAKLAPWLTLDGDEYPAVVNGRIVYIVDGYTTSSNYPDSQLVNFHAASRTTLTANGASVAQSGQVNYLHNSVKAVVDAYSGKVTLYAWNQKQHPDALLKAWESVFPGLVQPESKISASLMAQLRYPTDLFNVQRTLLAKYHVTQPSSFYSGNAFWKVPTDPTVAAAQSINSGSATASSSVPLPSKYVSMAADGYGQQHYSLSSPMVTLNGQQLAAFVYVNSEPGPDYGKFTVLDLPGGASGESPAQVQNDIESNTAITQDLTLQRGGNSKVVLGDLQAIPVAGKMLYVEPVYTQSTGGTSFPILRHVIALYSNGDPSFTTKLETAIADAITSASGTG